jgi:trimeric autotransporter adhesin
MPTLQEVLKERYDDAIGGARGLGQLKTAKSIKGFIGSFDQVDYYKIKFAGRSRLSIDVTGMDSKSKLRVLDNKGNPVARSKTASINKVLDAGTYYLELNSRAAKGSNYTLKASAVAVAGSNPTAPPSVGTGVLPPNDSKDPGSLPGTALDTGKLDTAKSFKGVVGSADTADFYKFTVDKPTSFTSAFADVVGGGVAAQLVYDINGNGFVDAGDEIGNGLDIKKSLGAGTYFLGVTSTAPDTFTTYTLKLSGTAITGISTLPEPPIGLGKATDLGSLGGSLNIKQLVGSTDSTDVYKFTLNNISNFSSLLDSSQSTGNVTMSIVYDEDKNGIANPGELIDGYVYGGDFVDGVVTGGSENGAALGLNKTLGAGTYYLVVTQKELTDNTTYSLNMFVNSTVSGITPTTDPGSSMATATNLGTLTQTTNVKQFVGTVDTSDFYRFTLSKEQNIIISYNGTPELVGLRFGRDLDGNGVFPFDVKKVDPVENPQSQLEVLQPELYGNVVYSPLPPFYDSENKFDLKINAYMTSVPTNIYAKLPAGTYYLEVDPQSRELDLKDGLTRWGRSNVLYNVSFQLDG